MQDYDKLYSLPTIEIPQRIGGHKVLSWESLVEQYQQNSNRLPPHKNAFAEGNGIDLDVLVDKGIITEDLKDAITTIVAYEGGYYKGTKDDYHKARMKLQRFLQDRAPFLRQAFEAGLLEL